MITACTFVVLACGALETPPDLAKMNSPELHQARGISYCMWMVPIIVFLNLLQRFTGTWLQSGHCRVLVGCSKGTIRPTRSMSPLTHGAGRWQEMKAGAVACMRGRNMF